MMGVAAFVTTIIPARYTSWQLSTDSTCLGQRQVCAELRLFQANNTERKVCLTHPKTLKLFHRCHPRVVLSIESIKQLQQKPYALTCSGTPLGCKSIDLLFDELYGGFVQKDTEAVSAKYSLILVTASV